MSRSKIAIAVLAVALVASNLWWVYLTIDQGITRTYAQASSATTSELLKQALAVLNAGAGTGATREKILRAAQVGDPTNAPFEKEGYVWVGQLGLRFNSQGQLTTAVAGLQESGK
jgi:hypothetical protein